MSSSPHSNTSEGRPAIRFCLGLVLLLTNTPTLLVHARLLAEHDCCRLPAHGFALPMDMDCIPNVPSISALCYPVELAPRAGLIQKFPRFVSAVMHMLCWIGLIVSSISLVFLNLDKLFFFRFPLRSAQHLGGIHEFASFPDIPPVSPGRVPFIWSAPVGCSAPPSCCLHGPQSHSIVLMKIGRASKGSSNIVLFSVTLAIFPNRLHIYLPFMICVGVIPTVTSLVVAIYIMKVVGEHRRQIKAQGKLFW